MLQRGRLVHRARASGEAKRDLLMAITESEMTKQLCLRFHEIAHMAGNRKDAETRNQGQF